jgi:hypothetical protein
VLKRGVVVVVGGVVVVVGGVVVVVGGVVVVVGATIGGATVPMELDGVNTTSAQ